MNCKFIHQAFNIFDNETDLLLFSLIKKEKQSSIEIFKKLVDVSDSQFKKGIEYLNKNGLITCSKNNNLQEEYSLTRHGENLKIILKEMDELANLNIPKKEKLLNIN